MKVKLIISLFFVTFILPTVISGQDLCRDCALCIVEDAKHNNCCNECLIKYYTSKLKQGIIRGKLSTDYVYSKKDVAQMPKISDSISGNFKVSSIKNGIGYYLDNDDNLHRCDFFLIFLKPEESSLGKLSSIVLIESNIEQFFEGQTYKLTLHPYFKRDQGVRIVNDRVFEVVRGPETLFDLVYKNWLVCKLEYGINYFFR